MLSAFLGINGDVTHPDTTFSFLSPVMHEFLLVASFYLDQSVQEISDERSDLYYTFLAGLSDSIQRKPIEDSVGKFDENQQQTHKETLRNSVLNSTLPNSLLGGLPVREVIQKGHYTALSVCANEDDHTRVKKGDREALEDVISREFSPGSEGRRLVLYGGVGMGKTTAVEKVIWDWMTGVRLQHYALLMRVPVWELTTLGEKAESLQNMLGCIHTHISTETLAVALQSCGLRSFLHNPMLSAFLGINGDVTHPDTTFSFLSPVMHEFLLAASFYLDQSVQEISDKRSDLYYTFLAGLSDSIQRKPIEDSVGKFDESRISAFSQWLMGNVSRVLPDGDATKHFRVFRLLQHARNSSLVKESISKSQWRPVWYSSMQEPDCAALSYVVSCVGEMEHMNLYRAELTDAHVERLIPALQLSKSIG
ncbi:uncharacterized protein [Sinocyclocheilus grahami]|uniref:uncharacterized protein n=1 Tax=Sinocyclocheilus grahami TaxID=75366 RepID=UPI0007AC81BC|nr:PREDICTED: uncharacterized protein LOC107580288 [Sinocyclocheilus grahami]